jgi:hypothetical protein
MQSEKLAWIALAIVLIAMGCGPGVAQVPPTSAPTAVPPTQTPEPAALPPTQPPAPTPTPVPTTQTPAPTATAAAIPFPVDGVFAKASQTWEFKPDGTYITDGHTQATSAKYSGTYTVTGDQLVIQDDYNPCKDVVGTYAWTYDGEVLSITAVDDKCRDRANMARGKWRKKP